MKHLGRRLVMVMALLTAAPAQAAFGNGIRVGGADGRLHPFLETELRYDSNVAVYYDPVSANQGDLILHLRPGLELTVPGESVALDLRARLDWAQYFGTQDSATKDLSGLYADVSLGVGFNRKGQVGLELDEKFVRSNAPNAYSIASGINSNYNDFSLALPWRPRGGAMTVTLSGDWIIESYDNPAATSGQACDPTLNPYCDTTLLGHLGYNNFGAGVGLNWKFLPKTSAVVDLGWFDRLPNSTLYSVGGTGMRAQAGLAGLVTSHLAATIKAGYATTLDLKLDPAAGPTPSNLGTWLATASLEWIPSPFSSLKLSFGHDLGFDPGITYALYTVSHVTLDARSKFSGMVNVGLLADWAQLGYQDAATTSSTVYTIKPSVQAELSRWLMLELAYQYTNRSTDLTSPPPGWEYTKNELWLRGVVTY